ncbi:hypothetical protein [Pseudothermotoga elfii]
MRKYISFLLFAMIFTGVFCQSDYLQRIDELSDFYFSFDLNTIKLSILDAIRATGQKDVIAAYLDFVNNSPVWVVVTASSSIYVNPFTGRMNVSANSYLYRISYPVSLEDAISLAFVSGGRDIFFAFLQNQSNWIIGTTKRLITVSTRAPVVISIQSRSNRGESSGSKKGEGTNR